jgi:hypothetical protein
MSREQYISRRVLHPCLAIIIRVKIIRRAGGLPAEHGVVKHLDRRCDRLLAQCLIALIDKAFCHRKPRGPTFFATHVIESETLCRHGLLFYGWQPATGNQ